MLKLSQKFPERSLSHFSIHGLASLKNFWDHFLSIWLQIKKDYMQIVTKLIIPGKGRQKYGIQVVSFHHFKSLNHYTEPMKILPVVVRIIWALQSSLTKQLNFHQHLGGLTVSSLAFRWEGHGFKSHSVPSLKWKRGNENRDALCQCWMAIVVHSKPSTRNVAMVWLYTQKQAPVIHKMHMGKDKSRYAAISYF